jgi:hypothetical protein
MACVLGLIENRHNQSPNATVKTSSRARSTFQSTISQPLVCAIQNITDSNILQAKKRGFITTGAEIVKRETALGLYKGLGAVLTGIVPKMAIRFTSYEWYKQLLADKEGNVASKSTFMGTCTTLESAKPMWAHLSRGGSAQA